MPQTSVYVQGLAGEGAQSLAAEDVYGSPIHNSRATEWSTIYRKRLRSSEYVSLPLADGLAPWVAVKVVDLNFRRAPHDARKEAKLLDQLRHPNIVPLLCSTLHGPAIHIFQPLYPLPLLDLLSSSSFTPARFPRFHEAVRSLIAQLVHGVAYLHARGIAHRDLSVGNLALAENGRLVLLDFGTAWSPAQPGEERAGRLHFELGTMPYRAPELLFGSRSYAPIAVDLWALGALIAEFFTPLVAPTAPTVRDPPPNGSADLGASAWYAAPPNVDLDDLFGWGAEPRHEPLDPEPSASPPQKWVKSTLFDGSSGDFQLVGSIFKIRGTPTAETWPDANTLPDFGKFSFVDFAPQPLDALLPLLPGARDRDSLLHILDRLLRFPAAERLPASSVCLQPYLADPVPVGALGELLSPWTGPCVNAIRS